MEGREVCEEEFRTLAPGGGGSKRGYVVTRTHVRGGGWGGA